MICRVDPFISSPLFSRRFTPSPSPSLFWPHPHCDNHCKTLLGQDVTRNQKQNYSFYSMMICFIHISLMFIIIVSCLQEGWYQNSQTLSSSWLRIRDVRAPCYSLPIADRHFEGWGPNDQTKPTIPCDTHCLHKTLFAPHTHSALTMSQ